MYDPLTNPPLCDWNSLSNDERERISQAWEIHSCPHSCGGEAFAFYEAIRSVLKAREKRVLEVTMLASAGDT